MQGNATHWRMRLYAYKARQWGWAAFWVVVVLGVPISIEWLIKVHF